MTPPLLSLSVSPLPLPSSFASIGSPVRGRIGHDDGAHGRRRVREALRRHLAKALCKDERKGGSEAGRRRLYRRKIEGGRGRQEGKGDVRSAVREKGSALMRTGKGSGSF